MKRILNLGILFSLLFVSCQDEQLSENKPANTIRSVEIKAEMDDEEYSRTHTERDESDTKNLYKWDNTDQLSVFMGDATEVSCFKITKLSEDGRTAAFRGDIIIWGGAEEDGNPHLSNVAFYPYSENLKSVSYNKEDASFSLTTKLSGTQMWGGSGTFATNTAPMIAVTEDASSYSFRFKTIMAVSQLHLKAGDGYDASKIVKAVMTVDGHPMAGAYTVTSTYEGVKSVVPADDAVNSVSMENADGVELDTDNSVVFTFVHFPLQEGDKNIKFEFYDSMGRYMVYEYTSSKAFIPGTFMHFGRKTSIEYVPTGSVAQDLLNALDNAKSGDIVDFTLPLDIELDETAYVKGGVTLNLDLNGHTIISTVTDGSAWKVDRLSGELNVKNGTLANTSGTANVTSPSLISVECAGDSYESKLTLENVTLENNLLGSNNASYAINYSSTASVTLDNVTMTSVHDGIKSSGQVRPAGQGLWIKSGTYTAKKAVLAQGTNGSLFGTVDGGYFKSETSQCIGVSTSQYGTNTGINIRGGFFADNKFSYVTWEESGNADYPYAPAVTGYSYDETNKVGEIWTAKGMQTFYSKLIGGETYKDGTIKLTASIDMSGFEWNSHSENGKTNFAGTFDGGNHTISNLTLVASKSGGYATLFEFFSGEVKDLTIDGVTATDMDAKGRASAVAGYVSGGKLSGVTVKNLTATGWQKVAGLVANFPEYGELTIENCRVENAKLQLNNAENAPLWQAGGIIGYAGGFKKLVVSGCSVANITIEGAASKDDCGDSPYYSHAFIGNLDSNKKEAGKDSEVELSYNIIEPNTCTVTDVHPDCSSDYYAFGKARGASKLIISIDGEREYPPFVAYVDGVGYETLDEAIAAITDNTPVTLTLKTGEYTLPDITGKSITFQPATEEEIVKINTSVTAHNETKYAGSTLNFKNITLIGTSYTGSDNGYVQAAVESYTECTFENYYMFAGDEVTVTDCTFNGVDGQYFWTGSASDITFTRCKFNGVDRALKVLSVGNEQNATRNVTFEQCEFYATTTEKAVLELASTSAKSPYKVVMNGCTKSDVFPAWFSDSYPGETSKYLVVIDGDYYAYNTSSLQNTLAQSACTSVVVLEGEMQLPYSLGTNKNLTIKGAGMDKTNLLGSSNQWGNSALPGNWAEGVNLKFEDLTFTTINNGYQGAIGSVASVEFVNSKIVGQYYAMGTKHTFTGCTIDPLTGYLYTYASNCDFTGCTFAASAGKALQVYDDAGSGERLINITGCTFTAAKQATTWDGKPVTGIDINSNGVKFVVNITGCNTSGFPTGLNSNSDLWNVKNTTRDITVNVNGVNVWNTNGLYVADGVYSKGDVYSLTSKTGLDWFSNQITSGESFANKTITLTTDIDLSGINWTPMGGTAARTNPFSGVFDGNNKTIKNLSVANTQCAGFFGSLSKGTVKNLIIENPILSSNHFAGAIAAHCENNAGSWVIENCKVVGGNITLTPDLQSNGDYDNGDKAGGIVGYAWKGTINGCTVEGTTLTAYRDLGGIVGSVDASTVTNNTVTGATLAIDQETNYYGDKTVNVGQIIGRRVTTPTESGNTYSNVTITTKTAPDGDFNKVVTGGDF